MEATVASRAWVEVNLRALRHNLRRIRERIRPCEVVAVLKANAYGLGVSRIAATLADEGVAGFAVAEPREALQLLDLGLPVQVLGAVLPEELRVTVAAGIIHPVGSLEAAEAINQEGGRQGTTVDCHVLIDTGMGRLGILADRAIATVTTIHELPHLNCCGICSHFPAAGPDGEAFTIGQVRRFVDILARLAQSGITFAKVHIANSDAVNHFPRTSDPPFNCVRVGIDLHGSFDLEGARALGLDSVLTFKARLVAVRDLPAGMNVGYGLTHSLERDTRVGTVAAGYADGVPFALSNRGHVLVHDQLCPVLGRVSMDYMTVSLDNVPQARVGDEATCLGGTGETALTVDTWARLKGTHAYDILCSIGTRAERRYVN